MRMRDHSCHCVRSQRDGGLLGQAEVKQLGATLG
jgi:hypothetical protein